MASKKLPSWQFYPGDWMKDTELRSVSPAARGMWIDLLCLMFESRRRGFLLVNGTPPTLDKIARMTGFLSTEEAKVCLTELETSGVFSRTDPNKDGGESIIYCRRMVRDESRRNACRENGSKGGNPKLKGKGKQVGNQDNQNPNPGSNQDPNQKVPSSSSTSVTTTHTLSREPSEKNAGADPPGNSQPPDMPSALLDIGRDVLGLTCDALLTSWLTMWPDEWIILALSKCKAKGMRGGEASSYAQGIMRNWNKKGGPENDAGTGQFSPRHEADARKERPSRYGHLDRRPDDPEADVAG